MKKLRIVGLLAITLSFFASSGAVFAYSSSSPAFSVTPPQGWTTEPVNERMVRFYPLNEPVRFIVETAETGKATLPEFKDTSIKALTTGLTGFTVTSETATTLSGASALQLTLKVPDIELITVLCIKDGWGFRITAFEKNGNLAKYSAEFQKFLSSFSFSGTVKFPFREDFTRAFGDSEWYWVRGEAANRNLDVHAGFLRINAVYGDLWAGYNNAKNLLLRPAPSGDFEISTVVTINPDRNGQQAGLMIYQNDDSYLLLGRAYNGAGVVDFVKEIGADMSSWQAFCDSDNTYLKIALRGTNYTGYLSLDGKSWTQVYKYTDTTFASSKIGLFAFQSVEGAVTPADFDYFNLSEVTANQPPKAEFLTNPLFPKEGDDISFGSTSVDPDGDKLKYTWYLDGKLLTEAGNSPLWTWENAPTGKHTVRLVVDDGNGGTSEYTLDLDLGGGGGGGIPPYVFAIIAVVVGVVVVVIVKQQGKK